MRKTSQRLIALFVVLAMVFPSTLPAKAANWRDYMTATSEATMESGKYLRTIKVTNTGTVSSRNIKLTGEFLDSSGKVLLKYKTVPVDIGKTETYYYSMDFNGYAGGTYTLRILVELAFGISFTWTYSIKYTEPTPVLSFNSYTTRYNDSGQYGHRIILDCKNLKNKYLVCKIYNKAGELLYDYDGKKYLIKNTNQTFYFQWFGTSNGVVQPSGEYVFVISDTENKVALQKTLKLLIPQGG